MPTTQSLPAHIAYLDPEQDGNPDALVGYARLSFNRDGTADSVSSQVKLIWKLSKRDGRPVARIFTDDGRSAHNLDVYRPGFDAFITYLATAKPQHFAARHWDRLSRNDRDSALVFETARNRPEQTLYLYLTGAGSVALDMSNPETGVLLGVQAIFAKYYSQVLSANIRPKMRERRAAGKIDMLGYGFRRGPGGTALVDEAEAEVIREMAKEIIAGKSWVDVLGPLKERGIRNKRGGVIDPKAAKKILTAPRTNGRNETKGELLGYFPGPPILDDETFAAVAAALAAKGKGRQPAGKHLLSGLMICGRCGHKLNGGTSRVRNRHGEVTWIYGRYVCYGGTPGVTKCGNAITGAPVEEEVRRHVLAWQSDPARREAVAAETDALTTASIAAETELARLQAQANKITEREIAGTLSEIDAERHLASLQPRIEAAKAKAVEAGRAARTGERSLDQLGQDYDRLGVAEKRHAIQTAIRKITIESSKRYTKGVDLSRVIIEPR